MRHNNSHINTLEVSQLSVMRGEALLIDNLSFSLSSGDMLWITGANGIGKTSLLKCLSGLLRPSTGQTMYNGESVKNSVLCSIAYQGHFDSHKSTLTVLENLEFWQSIYGKNYNLEVPLKKVGLWQYRKQMAKTLSAGQSRRLALARLIIRQAPLWVLDEPTAAMDTKGSAIINALLSDHVKNGGIAILASHTSPDKVGENTRVLKLEGGQNAGF
ncbi:MAG: heme ABC exporter ATP-binding protein CcmA [Robiginitomaculum sp.]